jgi:hypothetical protein
MSYIARRSWGALTVIMSVFEGGDGSTSGGRSERSRESGDLVPDDARERCGEGIVACMLATMYMRKMYKVFLNCKSKLLELVESEETVQVLYQSSPVHGDATHQLP